MAPAVVVFDHWPGSEWAYFTAEENKVAASWASLSRFPVKKKEMHEAVQSFNDYEELFQKVKGQGGGIVLAKAGMGTLPALHASFVRLGTAAAGLILLALLDGTLARASRLSKTPRSLARVVPAAFLGSYVGIFLMMFGVGHAPASVAAVLLSTTPVFSLFLDAARGRERFTLRAAAGTLLAIAGVGVLTM